MRNRTTNKAAVAFTSIVCFVIFVALVFIVTSLVMASVNDRSLVDEWKSWGTEVEEVVDDTTDETDDTTDDEEIDDSFDIVVDDKVEGVVQNLANNYSNVLIIG